MAKKLDANAPTFDSDLDSFDFDTDISGELNQQAKANTKARGVVSNVSRGIISGAVDTAKDAAFIKQTLRKSLPKTYGEIADGAEEILGGTYQLYDQTVKELKPKMGSISRKLDSLVPEGQKTLKKLTGKMMDLTGEGRNTTYAATESQEDQAVTQALGAIFTQNKQYTQDAERKQVMRDTIDKKRSDNNLNFLSSIARSSSVQAQYTTTVTQAYQKRMLELQLRGYMASKEHYALTSKFYQLFQQQNEAVVKNTGMPEFLKITNSERFMEVSKNRFFNSLYGEGSLLKKGMDRLKNTAGEMIEGLGRGLETADMVLGQGISGKEAIDDMNKMLIDMGEPPLTKSMLLGAMAGGNFLGWLRDKISPKVREKLSKNKRFTERLGVIAKMMSNPAGAIDELRKSDTWQDKINNYDSKKGMGYRFLDAVMDHFREETPSAKFKGGGSYGDLNNPTMGFDVKAHTSLVDVIPGYLARIQQELRMTRTGKDAQLEVYDFKRKDFVTSKTMQRRMVKELANQARTSSSRYEIEKTTKDFGGGEQMSSAQEFELKLFFSKLARITGMDYTPKNIRDTDVYDKLSPVVKAIVDTKLSAIETSEDKEVKTASLTNNIMGIRRGFPSMEKEMNSYVQAGYGDQLSKLGLMKRDADGDYSRDEGAYASFIEKHGISRRKDDGLASSDINVKESIKKMRPSELIKAVVDRFSAQGKNFTGPRQPSVVERAASQIKKWNPKAAFEGLKKTELFNWKYKQGEGDGAEHYGPMAQDVNKNLGEDAAPTGKKIDLVNTNGATMAAVKHLGGEVEKLGFWKSGNPLTRIQKDVAKLVQIASSKGGRGQGTHGMAFAGGAAMAGQEGGYAPMLGNVVQSIAALGTQVGQDIFGAAGRAFSFGKDKVATPVIDYVKKSFNDKDNPVRKGISSLFEKATLLAGNVMEFGNKMVNETLPAGWQQIKDMGKKVYEEVSKRLNEARDLYLPGGTKPIIRALKLRSGFYKDGETGEPIFTMDALLKCKNDIKDAAGNIVLSVEEKAQGLIDSHGEKVKTTFMNFVGVGIGAAFAVKDKLVDGFKFLKDKGGNAFGAAKDKIKERWKNLDMSGGVGIGGKYLKDGYQVWVDIRDILLGDADKVRERLHRKDDEAKSAISVSGGGSSSEASEEHEQTQADLNPRYTGGGIGGTGSPGLLGSLKDGVGNLKNRGQAWINSKQGKGIAGKARHYGNKAKGGFYKLKNKLGKSTFGQHADDALSKLKNSSVAGKVGGSWNRLKDSKVGGFLGRGLGKVGRFGRGAVGVIGSGISNFFGGSGDTATQGSQETAHATDAANDPNRGKELAEGAMAAPAFNKKKGTVAQKDRVAGDSDGDGDKDGSIEDRKQHQEELQASRKKKAAEADMSLRYKDGAGGGIAGALGGATGFFDKLLKGASSVFDLATSGIGSVVQWGGKLLSKIPGLGAVTGALAKGAKGIMSVGGRVAGTAARSIGGTALRALGSTALRVAGIAAFNVLPALASGLVSVAGTAITAIGSVLSAPVVLGAAAVALAGYGIYKLYKYANRDSATELDRIRLRQYGVSHLSTDDRYNHYFYTLEAYLQDGRVGYNKGQAYIIDKNVKPEAIAEIFGVDKEDGEHGDAVARFYSKRFKPFFLTNMTALFAADPKKKLSDINSLTTEQQLKYLQAVSFESGPYTEDKSPIKGLEALNTDSSEVSKAVKILIEKLSGEVKKGASKIELPRKDGAKTESERGQADYGKALREKEERRAADKAVDRRNPAPGTAGAPPIVMPTGEDGPRQETPKQLDSKAGGSAAGAPGALAQAPGGPMDGAGGLQFLKLGKGVNINNMQPGTLKMLLGMAEEYGKLTGKTIQVNDGFRSYEQQAALHSKNPQKAAAPGKSLHEFGLAVDINSADASELEKLGLMKKYGFTRPVGGEPWHMEPAGIQRNIDIARKDKDQAAVMIAASFGKGGGGYGTQPDAKKFKRNHELAMALLDTPGKDAKTTLNEDKASKDSTLASTPAAVGTDGKSPTSATGTVKKGSIGEAANDPKSATNVQSLGEKGSSTNSLPSPESVGGKPTAVPDSEQAVSGSGSSGKAASKGSSDVKDIISKSAKRAGGDPNMMLAFAAVESDMNPNAKAKGASAAGAYGFLSGTWKEMLGKYGSKYSLDPSATPYDPEASTLMATEMLKSNLKGLGSVKSDPTFTDAYLTHFLGLGGARKFLSAKPDAIAAEVLPSAAKSNKSIFYEGNRPRTIKEVYDNITKRLKAKVATYGINVKFGSLAGGATDTSTGGGGIGAGDEGTATTAGKGPSMPAKEGSKAPASDVAVGAAPPSTGTPSTAVAPTKSESSKMIAASSSSGVFVDKGGNAPIAKERRESGEAMAGPSMTKLESAFDKSVGIQEDQLSVLKDILSALSPEKLKALLGSTSGKEAANGDKGSMKEQDKANMGRKDQAASSPLDFTRKSM